MSNESPEINLELFFGQNVTCDQCEIQVCLFATKFMIFYRFDVIYAIYEYSRLQLLRSKGLTEILRDVHTSIYQIR